MTSVGIAPQDTISYPYPLSFLLYVDSFDSGMPVEGHRVPRRNANVHEGRTA